MTEEEYIETKALGTITSAINTLSDLVPANLKGIISDEEYSKVMPTLCEWQDRLFKKTNIDE